MRLKDKVAIVTGSGRGIGEGIVMRFAEEGAKIIVNDVNEDDAKNVVDQVKAKGGQAVAVIGSVSDRATVQKMVDTAVKEFGTLDIIVNNAGITQDARLVKMTDAQFDQVIAVNLKGVFECAQAVARIMTTQKSGVIINASSVVGVYGNYGQTNYAATKSGVIGFTKTWARELGPQGIRVVAVCPGFVETGILKSIPGPVLQKMVDKVPLGRLGKPEEIASVYAFLASDDASYINGAVIEVSGGIML